jgi:hypothetical protein
MPTRTRWKWIHWTVALVCIAIAILPMIPPGEKDAGDPAAFSTPRALDHIESIARQPHPIGSEENARVGRYLGDVLRGLGLVAETQTIEVMDYFGTPGNTVSVVNVMARIAGTDPTGALALVAHYDTDPQTPGANDDSGGVAILLEIGRVLTAGSPLRNDVILLFTDGEEPAPRFGSVAFVQEHPWFNDVALVVNLEAIGTGGPPLLVEMSGSERWMIDLLAGAAPSPAAFSFVTEIAELLGGFGTDFDPFNDRNVAGWSFAYAHGSSDYHTERDSVSSVSRRSIDQQGSNTLALARTAGNVDLRAQDDEEGMVFFTVAGSRVVRYSDAFAVAVSLVGLAALVMGMVRRRRHAPGSLGRTIKGAGIVIGVFLAQSIAFGMLWMLMAGIRPTLGMGESYGYLLLLMTVACATWLTIRRRFQRSPDGPDLVGGSIFVWVVLALVTSLLAPGTSYLFSWPALFGSFFWLALPAERRWLTGGLHVSAVTGAALAVSAPAVDIFFQMASPRPGNPDSDLMPVAGIAVGLGMLVFALIHAVATEHLNQGSGAS